jgi:very-short-patch-repair endonuclease
MLIEAHAIGVPIRPSLNEIFARYPGHRGVASLREAALTFTGPTTRTRSDLEEDFRSFLVRHGLPQPHCNHDIETHIGTINVDCVWLAERVAIELDAPGTHGSRPRMLRDRRRDRALILAGWTPGRLMEEDLLDEAALARELTGLLYP